MTTKCLLNADWLSELSYIHIVKYYAGVTKKVKHIFICKALQDIFSKKCKIKNIALPFLITYNNTCIYTHLSYILI